MILNNEIIACEIAYIKCFSEVYEDENTLRFRNAAIPDMYSHNLTYIKKQEKDLKIRSLTEEAIAYSLKEEASFCNILANSSVRPAILSYIKYPSRLTAIGFYEFDPRKIEGINAPTACEVVKVESVEAFDDVLTVDVDADVKTVGRDFCVRRCYGKSPVYLASEALEAYLCYSEGTLVGRCDLFLHNGVAKLEEFCILEAHQHKGYGTALLKTLMARAVEKGAHTLYLVTDEIDSAKEMYNKLGFEKIGEMAEIRFYL